MRQLHLFPLLDASSLSPQAGWSADEVVHIVPAELPVEDIMRIWDAIEKPYRLSTSYVARVVRLDPDTSSEARPVVATRFSYGTAEAVV
jgi:Pvc16 N-terminal domain